MPSNFESFERSELAHVDDRADSEELLFSQGGGDVQTIGAERDRLRQIVHLNNTDDHGMAPLNVQLSTREW